MATLSKIQQKFAEKYQKCVKCGEKKQFSEFGLNPGSSTGYQTYCKLCKNALGDRRRKFNLGARLKHHFATRIAMQLGEKTPENYVKDLENMLGYSFTELKGALSAEIQAREHKTLRQAFDEDYHVDHIRPLSSFKVIGDDGEVDWGAFRACWAIPNLRAISSEENLKKGARHG